MCKSAEHTIALCPLKPCGYCKQNGHISSSWTITIRTFYNKFDNFKQTALVICMYVWKKKTVFSARLLYIFFRKVIRTHCSKTCKEHKSFSKFQHFPLTWIDVNLTYGAVITGRFNTIQYYVVSSQHYWNIWQRSKKVCLW